MNFYVIFQKEKQTLKKDRLSINSVSPVTLPQQRTTLVETNNRDKIFSQIYFLFLFLDATRRFKFVRYPNRPSSK